MNATILASLPTRTRDFRRLMPLTMISPAISGSILSTFRQRADVQPLPPETVAPGEDGRFWQSPWPRHPDGPVTPTLDPASSCPIDCETQRTANLLAEYAVWPGGHRRWPALFVEMIGGADSRKPRADDQHIEVFTLISGARRPAPGVGRRDGPLRTSSIKCRQNR
jgi:hypothetical protein